MYSLSFKPENRQTRHWGSTTLFSHPGKASRMPVSNPIWAGKLHSYIKKCITNRCILSTGSKRIFLPIRAPFFFFIQKTALQKVIDFMCILLFKRGIFEPRRPQSLFGHPSMLILPQRGQTHNWGSTTLFLHLGKASRMLIFVSNPIWARKLHSYIKKCITNRCIFSTGSKHK